MAAAISIRSATNTVVEVLTFAHVQVTGADSNNADGTERRYYIQCVLAGVDPLRSLVFSPSHDGKYEWDNLMFPADGTWTIDLRDVSDDSQIATLSQVVAARA